MSVLNVALFRKLTYREKSGIHALVVKDPLLITAMIISFNFLSKSNAPLRTSISTSAYRDRKISNNIKKRCTASGGRTLMTLNSDSVA